MEGDRLKTKDVKVVPYDENWPAEFKRIQEPISAVLGDWAVSIEHVGSTSVAGLWAKPILDIDVLIQDKNALCAVIKKLESIGYVFEGDLGIKDRYAFGYENKPHLMPHHLYVCPQNSEEWKRHRCLRNYLRSHPEDAQKYSDVKRKGAALFPQDVEGYLRYKTDMIAEIYRMGGL